MLYVSSIVLKNGTTRRNVFLVVQRHYFRPHETDRLVVDEDLR